MYKACRASTGGASASTGGAGWGLSCCRVFVLYSPSSAANRCGGTSFYKIISSFMNSSAETDGNGNAMLPETG